MTTQQDHFTSASLDAVTPRFPSRDPTPVRFAFRPWGRRKVGDPDPDHPDYQILDVYVRAGGERSETGVRYYYVTDVAGRSFVVADGAAFTPTDPIPGVPDDDQSLDGDGPFLAAPHHGGEGYIPVGAHLVALQP